jgi:hypothetical protein
MGAAMHEHDDIATLAADFRALSASQRREILGALRRFERVQFSALLENAAAGDARPDEQDALARFSPWLRDQIHIAGQTDSNGERSNVTEQTRAELIKLSNSSFADDLGTDGVLELEPSPSLVGTFSGLFSRQRRP